MTISIVGGAGAAAAATSVTITTPSIGDLIFSGAFRTASTTAPSLPAGYTSIKNGGANTCSNRVGFKVSVGTETTGGTWTNASAVSCAVYRSSLYSSGASLFVGGSTQTTGATTTTTFGTVTMTHADNTSRVAAFIGKRTNADAISTHAPAGMTFISGTDATIASTTEVCMFDTNGTVSSWSSTNVTLGTATGWVSDTVEIIENQPGAAVNNFVQHISSSYIPVGVTSEAGENFTFNFDPSLAGNGFVVVVAYPSGATPAITDDKGNTWPASGAAGTVTADNGAGNMALQAFVLASATTGTSQIVVGFGGNPQQPVKVWITQLYNVTGTISANAHAAGVNAGGIVSPGSLTPGVNNCLVLAYMCEAATSGTTNPALIVPETGYALNDADISVRTGFLPNASQFALQTTAAATTPQFYLNAGGADTYNVIALALTTGAQGTPKPSGAGVAPWIDRRIHFSSVNAGSPTTWLIQTPASGNAGLFTSFMEDSGSPHATSVVDSDGVTWTLQDPTVGGTVGFTRVNAPANLARNLTLTINATNQNNQIIYYDLSNCDTAPIVATASVGVTGTNNTSTVTGQPSITPTGINQLTISYMQLGNGPSIGTFNVAGAVYDLPTHQCWKGTASISGTSMTVTATTWGTFQGASSVISGAGVTAGTSYESGGASPFTINPSQTAASTTMTQSNTDSEEMGWGNGAGHYFNGSNLSAQSWGYSFANHSPTIGQSVSSFAIIFAGPPAITLVTGWQNLSSDRTPRNVIHLREQLPALTLTPATLPPKISGDGWRQYADRDPPLRRPTIEQPPAWDAQPIVAAAATPQGWQTRAPESLRKRSPVDEPVRLSVPPAASPTGWRNSYDEAPRRRVPLSEVATFALPIVPADGISGIGWFNPPDRDPPPRRPVIEQPPAAFVSSFKTAPVSGIGWFAPLDELPRKWKPLFDLAAWDPQIVGQVVVGIAGMAWFTPPDERRPPTAPRPSDPSFVSVPVRPVIVAQSAGDDPPRRRRLAADLPGLAPSAPAAVTLGWMPVPPEPAARRAVPVEAPPALPILITAPALGWIDLPFDQLPARRARPLDVLAYVPMPPSPPVGVAGMAWFTPLDWLARRWKPLLDALGWDPKLVSSVSALPTGPLRLETIHGAMALTPLPPPPPLGFSPAVGSYNPALPSYRKLTVHGVDEDP